MDKTKLGQNIRAARKMRKLTLEGLADKIGIGRVYLGEIERGKKLPSMKIFISLVETLEVSADYLLQNEVSSGNAFILNDLTAKIDNLSPQQRNTAVAILDAYIDNLP